MILELLLILHLLNEFLSVADILADYERNTIDISKYTYEQVVCF